MKAYSYIRFSSPKQLEGDSLRRQLEDAQKYVKDHNANPRNKDDQWELDKTLNLKDLGKTGWKKGSQKALIEFLDLVKKGDIKAGSVLIVENLDRLSRLKVMDAFDQFRAILKSGMKLVTLTDQKEFTEESVNKNPNELIITISYMARAHDESELKSKRLKKAWIEKRKKATENGEIITAKCPKWLKVSEDGKEFVRQEDIIHAINRIFELKLEYMGEDRIAQTLNQDKNLYQPPVTKRNKTGGWRKSYIAKILRSRAVIGEYQPYRFPTEEEVKLAKKENRKLPHRIMEGEPITNYYPQIIEPETFVLVQRLIFENAKLEGNKGGRKGKRKATNLFVYLAKCGFCGAPMHFLDKGDPPKGRQYLHCDHSRRKLGCDAKAIRYDDFEEIMFNNLEEFDISKFSDNKKEIDFRLDSLDNKIKSTQHEVTELKGRIEILLDDFESGGNKEVRELKNERLRRRTIEKSEKVDLMAALNQEYQVLREQKQNQHKNIENIKNIKELLGKEKDKEKLFNLRLRLRAEFQNIIKKVRIYPHAKKFKQKYVQLETGEVQKRDSNDIEKITVEMKNVKTSLRVLSLTTIMDTDTNPKYDNIIDERQRQRSTKANQNIKINKRKK